MPREQDEKRQHGREVWEERQDAKQQRRLKRQRARQYQRPHRDKFDGFSG